MNPRKATNQKKKYKNKKKLVITRKIVINPEIKLWGMFMTKLLSGVYEGN